MTLLIALGFALALGQSPAAPPGAAVSGQVVEDVTRAPIPGAQVTLFPSGPRSMPFMDQPPTTTTDRDGRFAFQGVEPGRYRIGVQKSGYTSDGNGQLPELPLAAGERLGDVTVALQRGAVISGRVIDEEGQPLVNANVAPMRKLPSRAVGTSMRRDVLSPAGAGAQTNDLGEFRLHSLAPGEYYVQAMVYSHFGPSSGAGATTLVPTYFPSAPDSNGAQMLTVAAGQTLGDVEIRMTRAPAFRVAGVVTDDTGRPVVNAMVRLATDELNDGSMFMMGRSLDSRTDTAGRFTINGVTSGAYTLVAVAPVLISKVPDRNAGSGGSGGITSFGTGSASASFIMSGSGSIGAGGGITMETRNGTTIEYRDDTATRMPIAISDADVGDLAVVVRPPSR